MFETLRPNGFRNTRVDDICAPLGYPRERTCGRSWKILSHKTVTFRKKFIKKTPDLEEGAFPINPQHPLARQCAESFADFSRKLFPSSAEALKRGWPTYPRDKAKIIEGIATLMCYQEFNWRKNEKYKVMAPAREMTDDIQEETGSDDEIHNERGRSNRESAGSYSSLRNEHIAQYAVTENIRIHLEYTYPLTVPPAPPTIDCLFNDNLDDFDLNTIDPFAYRYLHERCLYQSRPPNEHAITHFVEDLCGQVGKDFDQEKLFHMEKKCQLFVGKIFIYWKEYDKGGYGFLHKVDGVVTRTPEFEAAWRARRREWVDTVQGGYKDAPLELRRGPLPALVNQKRARSSSLPTEAPTTKRHRADQDSNESSEGFTITVDTPGLENEEMHTSVEELRAGQFNETHKSNDGLPRDTSTDWFGSIPYPPTSATPDPSTPEMDIEQPANALDITPPVLQGFNNFSSTAPEQMESDAAFSLRAQENALPSIISSSSQAEDPPSAVSSPSPTAPNKSTENDILPWDSTLFNRPEFSKRCVAPIIEASEVLRATLLKLKSSVTIGTTLPPGPGDYDQPVINSALARNETNSPSEPSKNTPTSARFSPAVECLPANVNHGLPDNIIPSASTEGSPIPLPSQTRSISAAVYENNTSLPSPISRSNSINMPATRVEHTPPPSNVPDYMDLTVANEGSSRPYAFSGSVLQNHQSIQPNDTPVVANANSIQPAIPNKPTLQFAIEDADSIPDEDPAALVSLEQLSDLSLTDFFTLVATRSGKPRKEALQHVTFRCQWGTMITLVANRDGGEEGWQKIKGKMRLIFKNEPLRYLKKKKFSVCVYAGDHRVCGVDSDEED